MYKVNDKVIYECPFKLQSEGVVLAKLRVLEDLKNNKDEIVYLIEYDRRCNIDIIFERNVIGKVDIECK